MTTIQTLDGTTYNLDDLGIRTVDFIISSPEPRHNTEELTGRDGLIDMGSTLGPRDITCIFRMQSVDFYDFGMKRDQIFRLLRGDQSFYLIDKRNPAKRWKVKTADPFSIPHKNVVRGEFEVKFICHKGYAESVGTTLDEIGFNELWQFGQGLEPVFDHQLKYRHNMTRFQIYNAGDILIDPREYPLRIKTWFSKDNTDSTILEITNETTGDFFRYEGQVFAGSTVILDRVRTVRSTGTPLSRRTNYGLITLAPGWNQFNINCPEFREIEFLFRFYYI